MSKINVKFPKLYPKQAEFVFSTARYTVVEAATKCGKTVACLAWLLQLALREGRPGRNYWWVAPIFGTTKIAYRRLRRWLAPYEEFARFNDSELLCELPNGASICFKSADRPDSLYGEDVHGAVMDEASRAKEESWHALRSTLTATKGQVKIIGNVKGRRNWAYRLARRSEAGEPDMAYFRLTAYDAAAAGIYDEAEIEDARRSLPEAAFNELYMCIPSDEGANPFGMGAILSCIAPLSTSPPVVFGIDLAKSVDWTVVIGLDAEGRVCRFERWQGDWGQTRRRIAGMVGSTLALADSTGVGDPIVEDLQRELPGIEGYKFSSTSKQQLMEGLSAAIQQERIRFPEGPIAAELREFEFQYTRTGVRYSAPEGLHDDCVMALALAVRLFVMPRQISRAASALILGARTR